MDNYIPVVYISIVVVFAILWVWALLDLTSSTFKKTKWKLAWLLIILFFPILGSALYLLLRKEFKAQRRRSFNPGYRPENHL